MIIWRGWGVLVAIIAALTIAAMQGGVNVVFGDPLFYKAHNWPKGLAFLLAGIVVYFVGRRLNNKPGWQTTIKIFQ